MTPLAPCLCSRAPQRPPPPPPPMPSAPDAVRSAGAYSNLAVYILSLRSRPERAARLVSDLRGAGVAPAYIHRVDAIAGSALLARAEPSLAFRPLRAALTRPSVPSFRLDALALAGGIARTLTRAKWRPPTPAEIATTLTHVRTLQLAVSDAEAAQQTSFVVLEDDADVSSLAQCWSATRPGRSSSRSLVALTRHMPESWEYLQLGSISSVAYRLPTINGTTLARRHAHCWGAVATLWHVRGAKQVLARMSAVVMLAAAAYALHMDDEQAPAFVHDDERLVPDEKPLLISGLNESVITSALETLYACGVVADSCLYLAQIADDAIIAPALHGYLASPPLVLPHAAASAASSIQVAKRAAQDARSLRDVYAWSRMHWCDKRATHATAIPLGVSAGVVRAPTRFLCSPPGQDAHQCEVQLAVTTLPRRLCGRCSA